jgi:hypothetical protein
VFLLGYLHFAVLSALARCSSFCPREYVLVLLFRGLKKVFDCSS